MVVRAVALSILGFFSAALSAQSESEPNDEQAGADLLPVSTATTGNIGCGNNTEDWFAITTVDDGRVDLSVDVSNTGVPGSLQVQVFNSGGGLLANVQVTSGTPIILEHPCYSAGLYYLRLFRNSADCYSYSIAWTLAQPVYDNDTEPNNSTAAADADPQVDPGTSINGHVNFYHYGDNSDYYRIESPDQGRITFTLIAETVGADDASGGQLQLFNSGGGLLENWSVAVGGYASPDTTTLTTYCKGAGTYYVRFYANSSCGVSYRFRFDGSAPVYANDMESNDNIAQASAVAYNTFTEGRLAFYYDDNDDWYAIDPPDQGIIQLEVSAENVGPADVSGLQVQFFNEGGGLMDNWSVAVGGGTGTATTVVSTSCKGTGTYYVRIFANTPCGVSYVWRYSGSAPFYLNDTESNDNLTDADPVDYDSPQQGRVAFYYDDNDDWYRIDPPDQGIIHIEVMAENAGSADAAGLQVQFFNDGGGLLENWSVGVGGDVEPVNSVVSTICKGTGVYYVRFFANTPCGVSYQWSYNGSAPVYANDPENNDNPTEAVPVSYDDPMEGRLAFYYDDNSDYYRIDPPDQGIIHIEVMAESVGDPDGAGMQVQFYNEGGGLLDNWSVPVGGGLLPDTTVVSTTCKGTGIYYVRFFANAPCGVSYKWRYSGTAPVFANDAEQNDNSSQADTIPFNSPTEGRSAFYYDDNEDWFAITPVDASIIHITISAEHVGDTDPSGLQVQFFNDGGGLLENWSIAVGGSSVPATTTIGTYCRGAGTYYLRLYANSPCGISYSWECTATVPAFGADAEPNNTTAQATPISLANWWQDGRLEFYYGDNDDWYGFAIGAEENVSVSTSAENPGEEGTMQVQLFNSGGGLLGNLTVDVGGNGVPVQDVADFGLFPAGGYFLRVYSNSTCGVSYRLLCYDADGDGICDGTALGTAAVIAPLVPISARPNPSADGSFILTAAFTPAWMEVRDMNGQLLLLERMPTVREWRLDLSQRPAGVYSVRVVDPEGHATTTRLVRF